MATILSRIRTLASDTHHISKGIKTPVPLSSSVVEKSEKAECEASCSGRRLPVHITLPPDLVVLWDLASGLRLFEDTTYGQWGMIIWSLQEALEQTRNDLEIRGREFAPGDLVVGQFLGDSDVVIVRCDRCAPDFGHVIVALPIDPREDWYQTGTSLSEFLERFMENSGDKFWELHR